MGSARRSQRSTWPSGYLTGAWRVSRYVFPKCPLVVYACLAPVEENGLPFESSDDEGLSDAKKIVNELRKRDKADAERGGKHREALSVSFI